ncbi:MULTISPECIES: type I glyceraldehyde-3-phosphate dehydrogenase [unclassified Neisseria]|uniref:type I glyceraldehyde-3-phosphate dehydrogenase n=1 Tax=unclassified Neisseria TaxID=2623750 RepID=UPI002665D2F8|nr:MULTISPECIES: type I glyceraldehyde-3-phosphate dehydrogenase [unclassified Neisseria]MDO1508810.1 type I glyceraldehyde-3-phosphate dehydrogenase [Neisseria sp. MVDL19-042950]MDO1515069.1 type I glyceraldehyde-3-phosphate dehydrogenase [Neisseria sp. MVDL18-041461]MDO1562429.1 type I glyceraldehyde-3-phosphate dehydrogenase [Neisseria sp. MVDL20-010259]
MGIKVAINGYGRIGRQVLRAIYDYKLDKQLEIVAVNASGSLETNAHLTKFDTIHGRFDADVSYDENHLVINGKKIPFFSTRNPAELPWELLGVDLVMECTGAFTSKAAAKIHLESGAKKVLISAPADEDVDATIVYGVNHDILTEDMTVVSNASCTTNCLAPVAKALNEAIGINKGLMTTIHALTNDQTVTDVRHKDLRRARSGVENMIPTKTGAAKAVGLVLPELKGRLDGLAIRVPTVNVSLVDLSFEASRDTSVEEINGILKAASEGEMKGILGYNTLPLVSMDFNHTTEASNFDSTLTKVSCGNMVKVFAWYDNEWGFSCQMLNTARAMFGMEVTPFK